MLVFTVFTGYLGENQFVQLPASLGYLVNLQTHNIIILMVFSEVDMLTLLDLGENQLCQLPASLGYLVNLQTLNLREEMSCMYNFSQSFCPKHYFSFRNLLSHRPVFLLYSVKDQLIKLLFKASFLSSPNSPETGSGSRLEHQRWRPKIESRLLWKKAFICFVKPCKKSTSRENVKLFKSWNLIIFCNIFFVGHFRLSRFGYNGLNKSGSVFTIQLGSL
jgi:hypothetical protein